MDSQAPPTSRPTPHRWLRRISWVLMGTAVLIVGYVGTLIGYQSVEQHRLSSAWDHDHPAVADATPFPAPGTGGPAIQVAPHAHLADGEPVGRLSIQSVGFSAIVTEGADSGILSAGPGHDDRTGYPGEGRLIVIGNHNGFSFSWDGVHTGDVITVEMAYGRYRYKVVKRSIVDGDEAVLSEAPPGEVLDVSTCWPLWQGAFARQRLVFTAVPVAG